MSMPNKSIITLAFLCWLVKPAALKAQNTFFANIIYEWPAEIDSFRLLHNNYLHIWSSGGHSFFEFKINITGQIIDTIISFQGGKEYTNAIFVTPVDGDVDLRGYSYHLGLRYYQKTKWEFYFHFKSNGVRIVAMNNVKLRKISCYFICGNKAVSVKARKSRSRKITRVRDRFLAKCNSDEFYFTVANFKVNINGINYTYDRLAHPQLQPTRSSK